MGSLRGVTAHEGDAKRESGAATKDTGIERLTAEVATRGLGDGDDSWVLAGRHQGNQGLLVSPGNSGVILGVSTGHAGVSLLGTEGSLWGFRGRHWGSQKDLGKLMVLHWRRRSCHHGYRGHKLEQGELEGRYRDLGTTKDSGDVTRNSGVTAWKSGG